MNRRELLTGIGASALAWAFGCGGPATPVRRPEVSGEVRTWLRDAIARLVAVYPHAHALAVSRRRTAAAIDVLGTGVARTRVDGLVLSIRDRDGARREQVTSDLSRDGVAAAVKALVGDSVKTGAVSFGRPVIAVPGFGPRLFALRPPPVDPRTLDDRSLRDRVEAMATRDRLLSSRIVYAAGLIDIDDATVWSIGPGNDREQRLVRVRRSATRVAWHGTRPVVGEAARGWIGGVDDQELAGDDLERASRGALELMTPGSFDDGVYDLVLEPSVGAAVIDAATRGLLTREALRRPEVARRLALGANVASETLTLADDPTVTGAYGGFAFDDAGEPATRVLLVDRGHVVGRLGDGRTRRPGHLGKAEAAPSHLALEHGTTRRDALLGDGFRLEGAQAAVIDASSDRIVVGASRAREWRNGGATGRVFADVELVGELAPLLASMAASSIEAETIVVRDEIDGLPRWRSIETPWLRGRGAIRARRIG